MRKKLISILLLLIALDCTAQQYYFRHYKVENGLSNNSIICSIQDRKGFMWFGTKDGLNRYDGYVFKIFRNIPDDPKTLGNNFILSLQEDRQGVLWVGTYRGLYRFDATNEEFSLVEGTANDEIRDIQEDSLGNIWYVLGRSLHRYNPQINKHFSFNAMPELVATSITLSPDGHIWIALIDGKIASYEADNDHFKQFRIIPENRPFAEKWIEDIMVTSDNKILVGTGYHGVKEYNIYDGKIRDIITYNDDGTAIFARDFIERSPKEYWIATESGIFIYHTETGKVENLKKDYGNPYSISDNALYTLCVDKEGGIWGGTYFGGINYFPSQFNSFEKFFPGSSNPISGNAVREICEDKYDNMWIGTEDAGLNMLDKKTGRITQFKPTHTKGCISYSNIHGLLATGDELWVGLFEHGLDRMNLRTKKVIKHYSAGSGPNDLQHNFVHAIVKLRSDTILIATAGGLHRYNRSTDDFTIIKEVPEHLFYTCLLEDSKGTIWAGTYRDGLYYYHPQTGEKKRFVWDEKKARGLPGNRINKIFESRDGVIWVATENGLARYNKAMGDFTIYSTRSGFPSDIIYGLLEDDNGKLWVSSSKGLIWLDPATGKILVFTKANGLLTDQFNYSSALRDKAGNMYFGSVSGLIRFHPSRLVQNTFSPPVYFTGFQIDNHEVTAGKKGTPLEKSITYTNKISISHEQSTFSIDFAALSYAAPEMTQYAYIMEGLDKDWTYLKSNRKVYFTELSPGTYTFKVKAANGLVEWNKNETRVVIQIAPPFWASKLAYTGYILLIAGALFYIFRFYHNRTNEKNRRKFEFLEHEKEKEIYQAKIEFFTNIAHEIRTPLTLIKLPLEKIIASTENTPGLRDNLLLMEKNTDRLVDLTNQLLDFRKTESNHFSLTFVKTNASSLVQDLFDRFRPAGEQKGIQLQLKLPRIPLQAYIDPEAFTKILSNMLNNAVKYAKSTIEVHMLPFNSEDLHFTILVKNDGYLIEETLGEKIFEPFFRIKFTEKETGSGIGLALSRSLAELHKGSLKLISPENNQNVFQLSLPIHQETEFNLFPEKQEDEETVAEQEQISDDATKPVILLVDDNREILSFIAGELSSRYCICKAGNGIEALKILQEKAVQIVVSDIMMPLMDGLELCTAIKKNLQTSHIPIILLTAKNSMQSKIEGLEMGADAYIEKPFSQQHLQVQIANLLQNRHKLMDYFAKSPLVHIKTIAYSKADEHFLETLTQTIYNNLEDTELDAEKLARLVNMSRPTLFRKIKAISNLTLNELINISRLKKAAELLKEKNYKIYEIAMMVGYTHPSNFSRDFGKQFGMSPIEYQNSGENVEPHLNPSAKDVAAT